MKPLFLCYNQCSRCKKAEKWLREAQIEVETRAIVADNPSFEELSEWIPQSGVPITKFFNTSGVRYRELNIKEQINHLSPDELIQLLATDGKLIKRPLLIDRANNIVLVGFNEENWSKALFVY